MLRAFSRFGLSCEVLVWAYLLQRALNYRPPFRKYFLMVARLRATPDRTGVRRIPNEGPIPEDHEIYDSVLGGTKLCLSVEGC